jgi:hypothetical protein
MYGWLWRTLPGGTAAKTLQSVVLAAGTLAILLLVVFPWASQHVPFLRVTVEDPANTSQTQAPGPAAAAYGTAPRR